MATERLQASLQLNNLPLFTLATRSATTATVATTTAAEQPGRIGIIQEMVLDQRVLRPHDDVVPTQNNAINTRIADVKLFNSDLARVFAQVRPQLNGVPRQQVKVPVSTSQNVTDETLFEAANDAKIKFYLPRYRFKTVLVSGKQQYAISLQQSTDGGILTIYLEKYVAQSISEASRTAQEIVHSVNVKLRYNLGNMLKELEFQERTVQPDGILVVLKISGLDELTQVYQALSKTAFGTLLIVQRLIEVALPVVDALPAESSTRIPENTRLSGNVLRPDVLRRISTRRRLDDLPVNDLPKDDLSSVNTEDRTPGSRTLYRQTTRMLEVVIPVDLPQDLHGYIYKGIINTPNNQQLGLIRHELNFEGNSHVYYQDQAQPHKFYYLPDSYKIARLSESPHYPFMSISFESVDRSLDTMQATLVYVAAPFVDARRFAHASANLRSLVTNAVEPDLQLLSTTSTKFRLALPRKNTSGGLFQDRPGASVDVKHGIQDAITLPLDEFQGIYDSLFSTSAVALFKGEVIVDVGFGDPEEIEFIANMDDLAGEIFDYHAGVQDATTGSITVTLRNAIESPVIIKNLSATMKGRLTGEVATTLQNFNPPSPIKPLEEVKFTVVPVATAGDTWSNPVFDIKVDVVPDKEAVYNAILDPNTLAVYNKEITVTMFSESFAAPSNQPANQLKAVVVDFEHGKSVDLSNEKLVSSTKVGLPLNDFILNRESTASFRYRVSAIRLSGTTKSDWHSADSDRLFITNNEIPPANS